MNIQKQNKTLFIMQNFKDLDCKWGQPFLMNIPQRECKLSSQDVREYGFREKGTGFLETWRLLQRHFYSSVFQLIPPLPIFYIYSSAENYSFSSYSSLLTQISDSFTCCGAEEPRPCSQRPVGSHFRTATIWVPLGQWLNLPEP